MKRFFSILLVLGCASVVGARNSASEQAKANDEIRGLLLRMTIAERAGDATALSQLYEGDAMLLPSSGEPVRGRESIARRYQLIFANTATRQPLEAEELWVLDDLAVSRGAIRGPSSRHDVKGPIRNRYTMTLKRHGDSWEIQTLVWNQATSASARPADAAAFGY
jgi:uncharacterized protein (TIGR02246 family)